MMKYMDGSSSSALDTLMYLRLDGDERTCAKNDDLAEAQMLCIACRHSTPETQFW